MSRKQSTGLSQNLVSLIRKAAVQLEHDGRASLAIRLLKQLLKDGDSHLPVAEKARLRATLGGMVWKRGSVEKAHALAADALSLAEECDDPLALSEALFVLGEVTYIEAAYMGWGDLDTAMTYHQRCLKMHLEAGNRHGESLSLSRIGVIHERRGDQEEAETCYEAALLIAEELDFSEGMFRPLVHIGLAKDRAGDLSGALVNHRRSLATARCAHDVHSLTFGLCNVAEVGFRHDGRLEPALALLREALELAKRMDFRLALCRVPLMTGEVYLEAGMPQDAEREFEQSLHVAEAESFPRFITYLGERINKLKTENE
ncbi:tetratricopeptide repeat protein [Candidatus Bipolaricaulota bacterium]|nr:tetratricopeptide repeat protein [Candidatus Bipolaricaulota bacterium]